MGLGYKQDHRKLYKYVVRTSSKQSTCRINTQFYNDSTIPKRNNHYQNNKINESYWIKITELTFELPLHKPGTHVQQQDVHACFDKLNKKHKERK